MILRKITAKNHTGIRPVKTSADVENMIIIKSQITSYFAPLSDEKEYFLESHPSPTSETAVRINMISK